MTKTKGTFNYDYEWREYVLKNVIVGNVKLKRVDTGQITTVKKVSKVVYPIPLCISGNIWVWGNSDELEELRFYRSPRTENFKSWSKQKGFLPKMAKSWLNLTTFFWNWIDGDKSYLKWSCDAVALSAIYMEPQNPRKMTTNTTQNRDMSR